MSASDEDAPRDAAPIPAPEGVGALVLFTARLDACVAFYRALGLPLAGERHGSGPMHHTCDLGGTHFALFEADASDGAAAIDAPEPATQHAAQSACTRAPEHRSSGSQFFGLSVRDLAAVAARVRQLGVTIRQEPTQYPWGRRMLVDDPDGRVVELFERPSSS